MDAAKVVQELKDLRREIREYAENNRWTFQEVLDLEDIQFAAEKLAEDIRRIVQVRDIY